MRYLIITYLFLFCFNLFGQINERFKIVDSTYKEIKKDRISRLNGMPIVLVDGIIDWKQVETKLDNQKKDEYINKIVEHKFFEFTFLGVIREEFHLIDFNNDGKLDLIYTGRNPEGGEIDNFAFFENQGDSLRLTFKQIGTVVSLKKDSIGQIEFVVWEWPCCAGILNTVYYYRFYNNTDKEYSKNEDIGNYNTTYGKFIKNNCKNFYSYKECTFLVSTKFPNSFNYKCQIDTIINFQNKNIQTNPKEEWNYVIGSIKDNSKVQILNESSINGELYYFTQFSISDIEFNKQICEEMNCIGNYKLFGWIKKNASP